MLKRDIITSVYESLDFFPAVLIIGARQVGKSTLVQQVAAERKIHYVTLDDLTTLTAISADADGFLGNFASQRVALDEIQRAPDLMRALKREIDRDRQPGRFLLTGSANILAHPQVTESLAGRMDVIHLEGLSANELQGNLFEKPLVELLLAEMPEHEWMTTLQSRYQQVVIKSRQDWLNSIYFGQFPASILHQQVERTRRWISAYETSYIERDVRDLSKQIDVLPFRHLFHLCGLRTGNLVNLHQLGTEVSLDQRTISRYLGLLELTFQVSRLAPWFTNSAKKLVKSPKIYVNDSSFGCHMMGLDSPAHLAQSPMLGSLLETWVFSELRAQIARCSQINIYFYRSHQGTEVDFVLTRGLRTCGIEVKWSSQVEMKDFRGLVDFRSPFTTPPRGIILYTGDTIIPFGNGLYAVPLSALV